MAKIKFGEIEIPLTNSDMSLDEAKNWLADAYPAVEDAEGFVAENGDYVFEKRAGRKGC